VRLATGIVIFAGRCRDREEILYLLGILLDPANQNLPFPVVFTGPADRRRLFPADSPLHRGDIGSAAQARYKVIIDESVTCVPMVRHRREVSDMLPRRRTIRAGFIR